MLEIIVTWIVEPLDGGSRSEIMLVRSHLANNDVDNADRIWSYFIGKFAEHCKEKQSSDPS